MLQSMGPKRVRHDWVTEQQQSKIINEDSPTCTLPIIGLWDFKLRSSTNWEHKLELIENMWFREPLRVQKEKVMSIELVMPSNHLVLCHPLLLPPSTFPSIMVFSDESVIHIRWSKYWSFSFRISLSNAYLGLISFRMDWLDLLAVPGNLKSLLQHHSSKASILQCSAFFVVQLSHL